MKALTASTKWYPIKKKVLLYQMVHHNQAHCHKYSKNRTSELKTNNYNLNQNGMKIQYHGNSDGRQMLITPTSF